MQQKFNVGDTENLKPFLAIVLQSRDCMKSCSTKNNIL